MLDAGRRALAGLVLMLSLCGGARGLEAAPAGLVHFDMPRQPLQAALTQFHDLTGQSLLYDDAIADERMAGPLQGELTPEAALHSLLAGTGIVARYTSQAAFMLIRPPAAQEAPAAPPQPQAPDGATLAAAAEAGKRGYYGRLQAQVAAALCGDPATIPGGYRLALNVWVGDDGAIARVLLHPTGNARRDLLIRARLTGLALEAAPPAGVAQPITLVILPRQPAQTGDCAIGAPGTA